MLGHDFHRRLAGAETLNFRAARSAHQAIVDFCVDLFERNGNVQATLQLSQRFQAYLHCNSLNFEGLTIRGTTRP